MEKNADIRKKQGEGMTVGPDGFNLVRLRYRVHGLPERLPGLANAGQDRENPVGVNLEPPFRGARVLFVETVENGYVYVWWIEDSLMRFKRGLGLPPAGSSFGQVPMPRRDDDSFSPNFGVDPNY